MYILILDGVQIIIIIMMMIKVHYRVDNRQDEERKNCWRKTTKEQLSSTTTKKKFLRSIVSLFPFFWYKWQINAITIWIDDDYMMMDNNNTTTTYCCYYNPCNKLNKQTNKHAPRPKRFTMIRLGFFSGSLFGRQKSVWYENDKTLCLCRHNIIALVV